MRRDFESVTREHNLPTHSLYCCFHSDWRGHTIGKIIATQTWPARFPPLSSHDTIHETPLQKKLINLSGYRLSGFAAGGCMEHMAKCWYVRPRSGSSDPGRWGARAFDDPVRFPGGPG